MSELPDDTLMALPRRATVFKALRRHRKEVTDAANGDTPLPAIPKDLLFDICWYRCFRFRSRWQQANFNIVSWTFRWASESINVACRRHFQSCAKCVLSTLHYPFLVYAIICPRLALQLYTTICVKHFNQVLVCDYMFAIKWHAIKCPHDYVSARLIVRV